MDGSSFLPTGSETAVAKPQKAYAMVFAMMALALAGCASGLGGQTADPSATGMAARLEAGAIVASRAAVLASAEAGHAYTVRLRTGELMSIAQAGDMVIATGTPVLVQYGAQTRVIPQNISIGY
jgi:hypothetical protein